MPSNVTPVSPPLRIQAMQAGGTAHAALLLAVRWNDEGDHTDALVVSEHGGIEWIPHDRVEAVRIA